MKKYRALFFLLLALLLFKNQGFSQNKITEENWQEIKALFEAGQPEKANALLQVALENAQTNKDTIAWVKALGIKGEVFINQWKMDDALAIYDQITQIGKKTGLHLELSYAYSVLAEVNRMRGFDSIALNYNLQCAHYALLAGHKQKYSSRLSLIGKNFGELNQPDSAFWYLQEAVKIKESIGDSLLLPITYEALAIFYDQEHFTSKAIEYYLKAIEMEQKTHQADQQVSSLSNLASLLNQNNQPQKAKPYAETALLMADTLNLVFYKAHVLANLGLIAQKEEHYDVAKSNFLAALSLYQSVDNSPKILDQYFRLAQLLYQQGDLNTALKYHRFGYALADSINNKGDLLQFDLLKAKIMLGQKKYKRSIAYFEKIIASAIIQEDIGVETEALKGLSEAAAAVEDYQLAFLSVNKSQDIQDSISSRAERRYAQQLEIQYKRAKQEEAIVALQHQNALIDLELQNNRSQNLFFATLSCLAVIAAGLGFYLFYTNRKNANMLREKNTIIEKALKEKDLLLREIHHRVKNNLQVISSLLKLQSRYIKDPKAITAINEGRTRVRSMALIHQNLYQKENLTGVKVKQYFSKLLEELFSTYRIDENRIQLETKIQDLNLDVDTIVPIGLIINELVSNALKYAFPGDQKGILSIRLEEQQNKLLLQVMDNGQGMENRNAFENPKTFGYRLIRALGDKLQAQIQLSTSTGTQVSLLISEYRKAA